MGIICSLQIHWISLYYWCFRKQNSISGHYELVRRNTTVDKCQNCKCDCHRPAANSRKARIKPWHRNQTYFCLSLSNTVVIAWESRIMRCWWHRKRRSPLMKQVIESDLGCCLVPSAWLHWQILPMVSRMSDFTAHCPINRSLIPIASWKIIMCEIHF